KPAVSELRRPPRGNGAAFSGSGAARQRLVALRAGAFFAVFFVVVFFAVDLLAVLRGEVEAFFAAPRPAFVALPGPDAAVLAVLRALPAALFAAAFVAASATLPSLTAPLTTPLNCVPGRNFGTAVFLIFTAAPVRGLRPVRAARSTF